MQTVAIGANLHEMSNSVFRGKEEKIFHMSSAEFFTLIVKHQYTLGVDWKIFAQSSETDISSK